MDVDCSVYEQEISGWARGSYVAERKEAECLLSRSLVAVAGCIDVVVVVFELKLHIKEGKEERERPLSWARQY